MKHVIDTDHATYNRVVAALQEAGVGTWKDGGLAAEGFINVCVEIGGSGSGEVLVFRPMYWDDESEKEYIATLQTTPAALDEVTNGS